MTEPELIEAIEDLLIAEKAALLACDLANLDRVATRKEQLLEQLEHTALASPDLQRLATFSEGNAALLQTVMRALRDTISLLTKNSTGPETHAYGANGEREILRASSTTLAHKA